MGYDAPGFVLTIERVPLLQEAALHIDYDYHIRHKSPLYRFYPQGSK